MITTRRRRAAIVAPAIALLLAVGLALGGRSATFAASSISIDPSRGAAGTEVQVSVHVDEPPDSSQISLTLIHEAATANDDPRQMLVGDITFDAAGDVVLTVTVPDVELGRYVTAWGCGDCSAEQIEAAAFPAGEFQVTAGTLPNTAMPRPVTSSR